MEISSKDYASLYPGNWLYKLGVQETEAKEKQKNMRESCRMTLLKLVFKKARQQSKYIELLLTSGIIVRYSKLNETRFNL